MGRKDRESAPVPSGRKTLLCGSKTLSLSWTPDSIFHVPNLQSVELLLLVLIQPSWPPCPSLFKMTNPPGKPLQNQKSSSCASLQVSAAGIASVSSAFNLFLNAPGKRPWTSTELAQSCCEGGKAECLLSHICDGDKLHIKGAACPIFCCLILSALTALFFFPLQSLIISIFLYKLMHMQKRGGRPE